MNIHSYGHFQASASFSSFATSGGGMNQMMVLMQNMMSLLQSQLGIGGRGFSPAPPRPNFGGQGFGRGFGNPGLSNFCGGGGLNLNINGLPPNAKVNINLNGVPMQPQHCAGQLQGQLQGQYGAHCGPQGQLKQDGKGKPISYTTRGGYKVTVNKDKISIKDSRGNEVKHWGDPHENLNGKHIKDWQSKQRTIVLDDGTKITMSAKGPKGVTEHTSIYDGGQNVQIDNRSNKIEHHSFNAFDTLAREFAQYDGETSRFSTNAQGDAHYYNIYNQAQNGMVTRNFDWLAHASQGKVSDLFDDPTHKKT